MAAQAPDRVIVDGVHTGAQWLPPQLRHPTGHQPAGHAQQQQQQQLQRGPRPGLFPGGRLAGPRAGLRFWRDTGTVDREAQSVGVCVWGGGTCTLPVGAGPPNPPSANAHSQAPTRELLRPSESLKGSASAEPAAEVLLQRISRGCTQSEGSFPAPHAISPRVPRDRGRAFSGGSKHRLRLRL